MDATFLKSKFELGLGYADYVATGNATQQERWKGFHDRCKLSEAQEALVKSFTRRMNVLVVSGVWCGDCVEQVPLLACVARANPLVNLRIVDRDQQKDLSQQFRINGGDRVPVVLMMAEDFELCSITGDRPLARYRALAAKQLGPSCSLGAVVPPAEQTDATMSDWVNEFERVQLMLRLSTRLRQKHGD